MSNHLIIGLGGTGGKIIRAFRKTVYQDFRRENPDGLHLGYLYIDSSAEMMDLNDPSWKVLGHSVQLGNNSQLKISGADLRSVLDNIHNYPGIQPWIGDREQWQDILRSVVGETLGGQKRRLGRFLFANHVTQFNERLRLQVSELQSQSGVNALTFHVCCGLAGGTGSGSIVDVVAQIRAQGYADPQTCRVILYTLLPDAQPPQNWDTGNYHANGFAALTELNALSTGRFQPHDLTGVRGRLDLRDPFNGCYLFTNTNANGNIVDIDAEMPAVAADFLYQKIVAVKDVEQWPQSLGRIENAENGDGTPETEPGGKLPARGKRFMTFGIKRLAVPEEEIREYLTYSFTAQAALQLVYNHWQDGAGFQNEPAPVDFKEWVQQDDTRAKWRLKDDHLCLSLGILDADAANRRWKPIQDEWQNFITNSKLVIRDQVDKKNWLEELEKVCHKRYEQDYRNLGVAAFYETKLRAKTEMAKAVAARVQADLFDDWRTGARSLHEISRLLEDLIGDARLRLKQADEAREKRLARETAAGDKINANKAQWAKLGLLGKMTGKRDNLFNDQAGRLQEAYISRTWAAGWNFAKKLLEDLAEQLTDLKAEVDEAFSKIRQAHQLFETNLAARCHDDDGADLKKHLIRFYNPRRVKAMAERFVRDAQVQQAQTGGIRAFLVGKLGEAPGFAKFNQAISTVQLINALEAECEKSVQRVHDTLIQSNRDRLVGVSIIDRLNNRYGADPHELRGYIAKLVGFAGNYLVFDELERGKRGDGIPLSPNCITEFTALLPHSPQHADFMDQLKQTLRQSRTDRVNIIETDSHPNEITLISITNLFPLRFAAPLQALRQKYDQRLQDLGPVRGPLELHIEADGPAYPALFVPSGAETVQTGLPLALLAKALGIISVRTHQTRGTAVLSLMTKDAHGFDNDPIDLGPDLAGVPDLLTPAIVTQMKAAVEQRLEQTEFQHQQRRQDLIQTLAAELETLKASLPAGIDAPIYQSFLAAAKTAADRLTQER